MVDTTPMRVGDGTFRDGQLVSEEKVGKRRWASTVASRLEERRPAEEPSPFAKVLHSLGREVDRGEGLVSRAIGGKTGQEMGNVELLSLQAGVYRYSEAVDLSAKLVDRATNGVKTVLQGQ